MDLFVFPLLAAFLEGIPKQIIVLSLDLPEPIKHAENLFPAIVIVLMGYFPLGVGLGVRIFEGSQFQFSLRLGIDHLQFSISNLFHEVGFKVVVSGSTLFFIGFILLDNCSACVATAHCKNNDYVKLSTLFGI